MKIAVVGTGYVGLVTGTCLADSGNTVTCVDIVQAKIDSLNQGQIPIYEPGLAELVARNITYGRLHFTTDLGSAAAPADLIFLAVGTPQADDGSADLSALWQVARQLAPHLRPETIVVVKSTVPVGTNAQLHARLRELTGRACHVASNPEFLKEGTALEDFTKPDRVVVGVRSPADAEALHHLYAPFLRTDNPFLVMSPESAELTKYVANALLATKISFINQMANVCEKFQADINDVRRGIGHDHRIGFAFLFPGVGYGGSCFPKDVRAMIRTCQQVGVEPQMLHAVDWVNEQQKLVLQQKIEQHFRGDLAGRTLAIWGLAFKPRTDDIREAPALVLIDRLLQLGAHLRVHDPEAMRNVRELYGDKVTYCQRPMDALDSADALAILTEWAEFRNPDLTEMRERMAQPVVFDGRNLYGTEQMHAAGFVYHSIGRPTVGAD
jgi:UDPglucose 6-dehydrogenase